MTEPHPTPRDVVIVALGDTSSALDPAGRILRALDAAGFSIAHANEADAQIAGALHVASEYAMYDGDHHKMWVIDQMVRHLTGCPTEQRSKVDATGKPYTFDVLGESEAYREFVGDDEDDWDEGIAP